MSASNSNTSSHYPFVHLITMVRSKEFLSDDDEPSPNNSFMPPMVSASPIESEVLVVDGVATADSDTADSESLLTGTASLVPELQTDGSSSLGVENGGDEVSSEDHEKKRSVGAGIATGVLGTLFLGPIFGVLLGFGAAYAATKQDGAMGDSARALGDVALVTQQKAQEIDQKHHVMENTKAAAEKAWEKAKEMDKRHNILVKTKDFGLFCFNSTKDFCVRHRLAERTVDATQKAASWASEQIEKASHSNNDTRRSG